MDSTGIIVDDKAVQAALGRALIAGTRPQTLFAAFGRYGVSSTRLRFRNQVDPDGQRWFPSQRVRKHGGQTLRLSGRLRNSVTFNVLTDGVEWGTNVAYGPRQQFGFDRVVNVKQHFRVPRIVVGKGKKKTTEIGKPHFVKAHTAHAFTPRRAFLGVNQVDRGALLNIATEHIVKAVT